MLGLLFAFAGCGQHADSNAPDPLSYGACPDDLPGEPSGRDCATTPVPLRWDQPEGQQIPVIVVRYRAQQPAADQLWLLDGGPGGTGATYMDPNTLAVYRSLGLDIYIPQHRGTGHSTPLHCDDGGVDLASAPTPANIASCGADLVATWGEGLRGFHSDEAGRDVGFLIERSRQESGRAFVYGVSYGSYWAQRYLQAFPHQAAGAILQGVFPLGAHLWEGDAWADMAGRSLFQACRDQAECFAAFGEDPEGVAQRVVAQADDPDRRCLGVSGPDRSTLEQWFDLLISGDAGILVPGLLRRLARCNEQDRADLGMLSTVLATIISGTSQPSPAISNDALGVHILRSDIMAGVSTLPLGSLLAARQPLVFWSAAGTPEQFAAYVDHWPVSYPPLPTTMPDLTTPVLLMNGGLDLQTPSPWARALAPRLHAQLVEFPFVGHGVDFAFTRASNGHADCSLGIDRAFLTNPTAVLDTSCAATAYVPDLVGHDEASRQLALRVYANESLLGAESGSEQ